MIDSDTKNMISVWIGTSNKTLDEFNKYTEGICIEFTYLQTPAAFRHLTEEKASEQYDTISTVTEEESTKAQTFFRVLFLEERGDTWIVTKIWDQ